MESELSTAQVHRHRPHDGTAETELRRRKLSGVCSFVFGYADHEREMREVSRIFPLRSSAVADTTQVRNANVKLDVQRALLINNEEGAWLARSKCP